ncbi:MAG TPA: KR domain-containing protein, partial [Mycobacterium sp.]|nr:KR domain-containing protein [Mycobacterium sp.]
AAAAADHTTFIEISPHPILTHSITETLESNHHHSIGTLWRDGDDTVVFHTNLNSTHTIEPPETPHHHEPAPVLPHTPWQHTRHWISVDNEVKATEAAPRPGTLLGAHIAVSSTPPTHLWQARLIPEAKPYPGSHRHDGVELVPASVLLQTLTTAAAEYGASRLSEVQLEQPIFVDEPRIIQVMTDGENITVSSTPAGAAPADRWVRHVTARIIDRSHLADEPVEPAGHNPGVLHAMSADSATEEQPFGWSIGSIQIGQDALFADVEVPKASSVAVLDAAVHVARLVDGSNPELMIPAGVESLRWDADLAGDQGCAGGRVAVYRRGGDDGELVVDIVVQAPDDTVCLDIRGLRYVAAGPGSVTPGDDPRRLVHAIDWRPWHLAAEQSPDTGYPVAVVGAGSGAAALRSQLAAAGHSAADVAEAQCVLYLADPGDPATETDIDCAARLSTEVADLVRRLVLRENRPPRLWIITRGVRAAASHAAVRQSCLWGLAGVIRAEQPQLCGGLIDIPVADHLEKDIADSVPALATVLGTPAKSILSLRDGEFWMPVPVLLTGEPTREPLRCHPDAAYLITGGMGALGLLMAGWLVDRGARRLVLAGRTPLPRRRDWDDPALDTDVRQKIAAIRALERRGVSVDAVAVDIGSSDAVRALLDRRDDDGAPEIRGVIHAAGITEGQLLTEMADDRLRATLWPKVAGAQVLHEAFPPRSVDFFFLTAAAGAVFGVPGQGAYAAANAHLDGLARARHEQGCHTVSLDWVAWQGLGFGADAHVAVAELERMGSRPIAPDEAFAAWEFLDCYDVAQALMAPMPSLDGPAPGAADSDHIPVRLWTQLPADEVVSELEIGLRTILARELRMAEAELDLDRPFAELGLNSVMAMSVRRDTEQLVGIELSATMLWNHPTVAALAAYLAQKLLPEEASAAEPADDSGSGVLNDLFDSVEAAGAGWD